MKRILMLFWVLFVVLIILGGCHASREKHSCRLYVYRGSTRVYQIVFNGRDSLETFCGKICLDSLRLRGLKGTMGNKDFKLSTVYMKKSRKLGKSQACQLKTIISRLNSRLIVDTVKGNWKDVRDVYLSLGEQGFDLQEGNIKDPDIQMLVDSLIEYSPLFILDANDWWGMEDELELIRMFDKRKKK